MKRILEKLFWRRPTFAPLSYESLKEQRHIFVFGVWGRTSTTAFQRIMNSSRDICIWGEPGDFVIDNFMDAYLQLNKRREEPLAHDRLRILPGSFERGDFSANSAMAVCDWTSSTRLLEQAFVDLFLPAIPIHRIGFKEIQVRSHRTLDGLRRMFPNCQFVFVFRDPRAQWPSVKSWTPWKESGSLELFMKRVEELGNLYLLYDGLFIEDRNLRSVSHLDCITQHLGLSSYDPTLINDNVFAAENKPALSAEEEHLIQKRLGDLYSRLQSRSSAFFARR
jgi:hypothetical protein